MKLDKKLELDLSDSFGLGSTNKIQIINLINRYLFNSNELDQLQDKVNNLTHTNLFECYIDLKRRISEVESINSKEDGKNTKQYLDFIWSKLKLLELKINEKIKTIKFD